LQAASTSNPKIDNTPLVTVTVLIAWPALQSRLIDFASVACLLCPLGVLSRAAFAATALS
jgi:hypothetical protein